MFKKIYKIKSFIKWKEVFVLLLLIGVAATALAKPTFAKEENGTAGEIEAGTGVEAETETTAQAEAMTDIQEKIVTALAEPAFAQSSEESGSSGTDDEGSWWMSNVFGPMGTAVLTILSIIAYTFNRVIGALITLMIQILVNVASFDNIIDVPTVKIGWLVVRDLCNMSFILIFLFIAFATILRIESFSVKKALPKLLIVAVLINFSRSIFGIVIDFSQVIMLSFVHTFSEGQGWFIDMFNTQHLMEIKKSNESFTEWDTVLVLIAAVFAAIVTLIVITVMVAVLVVRLVLLWVYTILSPLAFLGFAFDPIKKYVGFIWTDFIKQVTIGPILAFFIWLALTTANQSANQLGGNEGKVSVGYGTFFTDPMFQSFLIVIALLIAGLMVAQKMGGAAGSIAGKGIEAAKGKFGPTPMRWGRERVEAFQKKRESERKGKAEKFGESAYGLYRGVSQQPKAAIKGAQRATGFYPGKAAKKVGNIPGIKQLRQMRQEKQKHRGEIFKTFKKGEKRTSEDGKYKYVPSERGDKVTVYKKDNNGEFTEQESEKVTSMGQGVAEYRKGYKKGFAPAKQIKDEIAGKRIQEQEKELEDLPQSEIKGKIQDKNASSFEKTAASLQVMKDKKFEEGEQDLFDSAKENVKKSLTAKRNFNDEADKHYAAWNNTEEGFKNKVDQGKVAPKQQDLSQFKSHTKLFADTLGEEFGDFAKTLSDSSANAKETVKNALSDQKGQFEKVDMSDPKQRQMRNSLANVTGNINKTFEDNKGNPDEDAKKNYVRRANSNKIEKILRYKNSASQGEADKIDKVLKESVTEAQFNNYVRRDVAYSGQLKELYEAGQGKGKQEKGESKKEGQSEEEKQRQEGKKQIKKEDKGEEDAEWVKRNR